MDNILITSISRKIVLAKAVHEAVTRILPHASLFGTDIHSGNSSLYSTLLDDFLISPPQTEITVEKFIGFCKNYNIGYVVPSRDGELAWFAQYRQDLNMQGIYVMISSRQAIDICNDKLRFYQCMGQMFPIIPTVSLNGVDDFKDELLVIKERLGSGSQNTYCGIRYEAALEMSKQLQQPIFQPYIQGKEASIDMYVSKDGEIHGIIPRWREVIVGGESQITTTFRDKRLENLCIAMVKALSKAFYGHILFQVIVNETGYHVIECNPRFGGASACSIRAGLKSFDWFLQESIGERPDPFVRCLGEIRYDHE